VERRPTADVGLTFVTRWQVTGLLSAPPVQRGVRGVERGDLVVGPGIVP
jgi:hypothetical protein